MIFAGRNDANPATHCFVTSPEMTVALTLAGTLEFDPTKDSLPCPDGSELKLAEPFGDGLPVRGFDPGEDTFQVKRQDLNSAEFKIFTICKEKFCVVY